MSQFKIRLTSKDIAAPPEIAILEFVSEKSRDEYWTAFWRNERGFKPCFWGAERVGGGASRKRPERA
jgi:hypothetical protein